MSVITFRETFEARAHYHVIVAGGGVAGCAAAITAAKEGKRVLLLEKTNLLGGLATIGMVNYFVPMCNGRGRQIIFGLCDKWIKDSLADGFGDLPSLWQNGEPAVGTEQRLVARYSPYIFALRLLEDVEASGAELLYDCVGSQLVMEGTRCVGVITQSKGGREYYTCDAFLDTTGDADLLRQGGIPTVAGTNFSTYYGFSATLDSCRDAVENNDIARIYRWTFGDGANLYGGGHPEGVPHWSGLTAEEVTEYLTHNQKRLLANLRKTERKTRELMTLPTMPQLRTTCHLDGDYTLLETDKYRHFDDSVCAINDFDRRDFLYEVPLRCLCRRGFPNILTAGRSASGEGYGWDVLRVIPPAILTGQAAAVAACMAIDGNVAACDVDIAALQEKLEKKYNIMIHFPDSLVPKDPSKTEMANDGHI